MSFSTTFKSIGHYFAVGAKYLSIGLGDVIKFANKAQPIAPEVEALAAVIAGPTGAKISDLGFNVLGEVAAALSNVQVDASKASQGVTLNLATQTVADVKAAAAQIEAAFKAIGVSKPAAK